MSKVFACLCALLLIVSVGATADETVSFTAVDSQAAVGMASYTATVTGGFTMGNLDWDGFATELYAGTYGSELTCDVSGPLGAASLTLGSGTSFTGPINFTGSYPAFGGAGDPAGVWTFDFYESYDDGADGLPDATWDPIDFTLVELVIVPGEEVCFTAVDSQAAAGLASYTATVTGGFVLGGLDWAGFASTIASGTYGGELTCAISGPLGAWTVTLGSGSTYAPGATFFGSDPSVFGPDPAGVWTFDFYETYDDLSDGLPDATWDDICFLFVEGVPAGEEVCFTAVDSQAASGLVSYTATLTGGFAVGDIDWDGFASTIASGTYGSELTLNLSGPLGSATIQLGSGSTYAPGAAFAGTSALFGGAGDPAGVWTFDFYETYDDLSDGLPDATWDDICFFFNEADPCSGPNDCASGHHLRRHHRLRRHLPQLQPLGLDS